MPRPLPTATSDIVITYRDTVLEGPVDATMVHIAPDQDTAAARTLRGIEINTRDVGAIRYVDGVTMNVGA